MTLTVGQSKRGAAILASRYANRHGLITGATGSGKTVSVARVAELLSGIGTPCLVFDAKGDLSGLAASGRGAALPCEFIDPFGMTARAAPLSFQTMGADATSRALGLSHAQSGVVDIAFAASKLKRSALATPQDMRDALARLERGEARDIGHVSKVSAAVVRRALLRLDSHAFAAKPFDVAELLRQRDGRGLVTIMDARALSQSAALYSATVAMILGELFARLPDIGDAPRPKLAIFIDESHLVFDGIEPALSSRLEQIVRLIRSRGVSLWFASQSPNDVPPVIAAQLANRIQHAMRAATRQDVAQVRAAAESMPCAPGFDAAGAIGKLAPGDALVSLVGPNGAPSAATVARIIAPSCRLGALTELERDAFRPAARPAEKPRLTPEQAEIIRKGKWSIGGMLAFLSVCLGFFFYEAGSLREGLTTIALGVVIWPLRGLFSLILLALWGSHHHHGGHRH